jgi:hypothetical protein
MCMYIIRDSAILATVPPYQAHGASSWGVVTSYGHIHRSRAMPLQDRAWLLGSRPDDFLA